MGKTTTRKSPPRPPTLEDLRYFLQLWNAAHLLQRRGTKTGARTVQQFAMDEFGTIKRADPVKELRRIGNYFGRQFFLKRRFDPDPNCAELASEIADCLRSLDRFVSREDSAIRLRLGVGHSVSMSLAPKIVARFREKCPLINVEIIVDNSVSLRSKFEQLEADLILTALPPAYDTRHAVHKINLRPALIAPRHHEVARRFRDSPSPYLDPALLTPKPDDGPCGRYVIHIYEGPQPAIPFSDDWFEGISVRFMRQSSYALVNELVACGNDLGVTLPHLLTVEQWRRVQVMPFQKLKEAQLSLLSVAKMPASGKHYVTLMDEHFNEQFSESLDCLTQIATEEMDALQKLSHNYDQPPTITYRCFLEMPLKKFDHARVWLQGSFAQHKGDDHTFVGDFELHSAWHESQWIPLSQILGPKSMHFKVEGSIEAEARGLDRNELVIARGSETDTSEEFCVAIVRRRQGSKYDSQAVGLWHGREVDVDNGHVFRPALGYFIMLHDDESEVQESHLIEWAAKWNESAFLPESFKKISSNTTVPRSHLKHAGGPATTAQNESFG